MSNVVTNLCRPLRLKPTPKCVLMALADRADDLGQAWPSLAWLGEWTCFGRRTIMDALDTLEAAGYIVLTREPGQAHRCQIVLAAVEEAASNPCSSRTGGGAGAARVTGGEMGEDRCGSRTGAAPAPVQEPHTPPGSSRTGGGAGAAPPRAGAAPNTSISISKTSNKTKRARAESFDPMTVELPDWMSAETWSMWVRYRAGLKKPVDVDGARLQLRKLDQYRQQGHDPRLVIEAAIENRWQGLFLPKDGSTLVKAGRPVVSGMAPGEPPWYVQAGFEHPAEAQNAECHIGNFREFSNGQRRQFEVGAPA